MKQLLAARVQTLLLNLPIFVLLAAVWEADAHPALTIPLISGSAVIFILELGILYFIGKAHREAEPRTTVASTTTATAQVHVDIIKVRHLGSGFHQKVAYPHQIKHMLASDVSTWISAATPEIAEMKLLRSVFGSLAFDHHTTAKAQPQLFQHGSADFVLKAGVLDVFFSHGTAHVCINDQTGVTMSGAESLDDVAIADPLPNFGRALN